MRWNHAILVFKKRADTERDDLDFARSIREVRRVAHELGFEDGVLEETLRAASEGNFESAKAANEVDELPG